MLDNKISSSPPAESDSDSSPNPNSPKGGSGTSPVHGSGSTGNFGTNVPSFGGNTNTSTSLGGSNSTTVTSNGNSTVPGSMTNGTIPSPSGSTGDSGTIPPTGDNGSSSTAGSSRSHTSLPSGSGGGGSIHSSSHRDIGTIIGAVLAGVFTILLLVIVVHTLRKRRDAKKEKKKGGMEKAQLERAGPYLLLGDSQSTTTVSPTTDAPAQALNNQHQSSEIEIGRNPYKPRRNHSGRTGRTIAVSDSVTASGSSEELSDHPNDIDTDIEGNVDSDGPQIVYHRDAGRVRVDVPPSYEDVNGCGRRSED